MPAWVVTLGKFLICPRVRERRQSCNGARFALNRAIFQHRLAGCGGKKKKQVQIDERASLDRLASEILWNFGGRCAGNRPVMVTNGSADNKKGRIVRRQANVLFGRLQNRCGAHRLNGHPVLGSKDDLKKGVE